MEEEQGAGKLSSEESWNRDIPDESCKNWQRIVNLLTEIIKTPVGLVMRVHESEIEVFVTSDSQGNPYKKSEMADLNTGRYCETVMSQQCRLLVPNALKDPDWDQNPDIELGMISYLGYPLVWPDGKVFGTLCVLDNKENAYSEIHQSLVEEFSYSINSSLKTIADSRILDVTCRKKAEEERLESLARFSGFAEASQYGMGMADLEGRIVYANSTLAKMLGEKSAEACLGKHFPSSYYPESSAKKLQEEVMPALLANGSWHGELELMAADGHSMPTNENYFVIKDASGNPRYFAGILTDISQSKLAEKALQESEEKYRIFFENSSDGMIMIQGNTIVDSNAAASQMLGYQKAEELIGLHPWELSPEYQQDGRKSKEKAEEMIASALKNGAHGFEWEHSKKENGDIIPVEVSLTAIPSKGKPLLHVTWRDISVRREAEQALRQSERKLQAIFDHHYQLTGLVDVDGKIIAANRTALSIAKTDESEVIGKYLWDGPWWEESQRQQIKEASKRAVEGDFVRFETTYRGSEGEQKIMDFSLSTVKDDSGKVIYLVPEGRDITDIRHTEDLLRENEKRLRILSDNLPGGMTYQVDIGEEGEMRQFNYVSAGVEYLHELKVEDVLADAGLLYSQILEEDSQELLKLEAEAIKKMQPFVAQVRFKLPSGKIRWYLLTSAPRRTKDGHLIWDGIELDITDRVLVDQKIKDVNEEMQKQLDTISKLNQDLAAFDYSVSNALMVPLRHITGFVEIIEESQELSASDEIRQYLQTVKRSSLNLKAMVQDLLQLSLAGRSKLELQPADIGMIVRQVFTLEQREQPDMVAELLVNDEIIVNGDTGLLQLAMRNLISNSFRFRSHDRDLEVELGSKTIDGEKYIYLKDNGHGFDPERAEAIFVPFHNFHSDINFSGMGLGLATTKRIIERHQGNIWAEGVPDVGTTIYFSLGNNEDK